MTLIDRYVYTVVRRLPEANRQEVEKELRANIEEMLPEDYTDADVEQVLFSMGNPADLAEEYTDGKRYLIGPRFYASYIFVIKLLASIVIPVCIVVGAISGITAAQTGNLSNIISLAIQKAVSTAAEATLQSFFWATLAFVIMERAGGDKLRWPYTGKPWAIKDLTEFPPAEKAQIPRAETIVEIVCSVIFVVLFCFFPHLFGWYSKADGIWTVHPFFDTEVLGMYTPYILEVAALGLWVSVLKLLDTRWTKRVYITNTIHAVIKAVLVAVVALNANLIHPDFIGSVPKMSRMI